MVSLLFVMTAMVEFAAMMFIQRRDNLKNGNKFEHKVQPEEQRLNNKEGKDSFQMEILIAKIDGFALFGLTSCYITFNLFYWIPYLITI